MLSDPATIEEKRTRDAASRVACSRSIRGESGRSSRPIRDASQYAL